MSKAKKTLKLKPVAILMGSDSDFSCMKDACKALDEFHIEYEVKILSAHRTPDLMADFARNARKNSFRVLIAGAGGAAHLPGMIAAHTDLPVIGVPVPIGELKGLDALYSIVQMPKGVPVATVAIGQAFNAGLLAVQILASGEGTEAKRLTTELSSYKDSLKEMVLRKQEKLLIRNQSKLEKKKLAVGSLDDEILS